jgi:hypothetical protein
VSQEEDKKKTKRKKKGGGIDPEVRERSQERERKKMRVFEVSLSYEMIKEEGKE